MNLARLTRTWLVLRLLCCLGITVSVEGARNRNINSRQQHNSRWHPHPASANHYHASRRNGNNGFSPNTDMYDNGSIGTHATSFYQRNGMKAPPLVSRATRNKGRGRRAQESKAGGEDDAADGSAVLSTDANSTSSEIVDIELDLIMEEAKDGKDAASLLREDLIFRSTYDRHAYPWDYAWYGQDPGNRTGVPVEFSINFHRVYSVDVIKPVLDLVVWMRIEWTDPRLTWKPEEYGNLTKTWFWIGEGGSGGETSEIWTPDIQLWNLEEGLRDSLTDAYAIVNNDGSIYWSRPGHLRPACRFYGLDNFPFDTLICGMEFGSWVYSGKYMRLVKGLGTGFAIGGSETAGESYNEFSLAEEDPVQCVEHIYPPYPASPEEDWPVLLYNITIRRSWEPYARGYLTLQVLLNIVGFSAFWLPPSCGERMGLSITAMLAAVAAEIVVAANLPVAKEYTWFQKFSLVSMAFAFISLIESVLVLYFYYKRSEDMIPTWYAEFQKWRGFRKARKYGGHVVSEIVRQSEMVRQSSSLRSEEGRSSDPTDPKHHDDEDSFLKNNTLPPPETNVGQSGNPHDDIGTTSFSSDRQNSKKVHDSLIKRSSEETLKSKLSQPGDDSSVESFAVEIKDKVCTLANAENVDGSPGGGNQNAGDLDASLTLSDVDFGVIEAHKNFSVSNFTFDDSCFQDPQPSGSKPILQGVMRGGHKRVSFCKSTESAASSKSLPKSILRAAPLAETPSTKSNSRPTLNLGSTPSTRARIREQFQRDVSQASMIIPRDADDFNNEGELVNNRYWKNISTRIDDLARFWVPLAFAISLVSIGSQAF